MQYPFSSFIFLLFFISQHIYDCRLFGVPRAFHTPCTPTTAKQRCIHTRSSPCIPHSRIRLYTLPAFASLKIVHLVLAARIYGSHQLSSI